MFLVEQRNHHIDHGKAGANQKDGCFGIECGKRRRIPRVGDIAWRVALRREISDRKGHRIGFVMLAATDLDAGVAIGLVQGDGLIGDKTKAATAIFAREFPRQDVLDV